MQAKFLKKAKPVTAADVKALRKSVEKILDRVREQGDAALAYYSKKFDGFDGPSESRRRRSRRRKRSCRPTSSRVSTSPLNG